MASKVVMDAVKARLGTSWSGVPVWYPNERTEPPGDGSAFIDVQFPVSTGDKLFLSRIYREEGAIRLVISAARGAGVDEASTWADGLAALFRDRKFGGIETWTPSPPVIDDDNENGNYFRLSLAIPYTYDFAG